MLFRSKPKNPLHTDVKPRGSGDATQFHATIDATPGWEGWFNKWQRTWDSPTPDAFTITDEWAVEKGEGPVFHWTTRLPMKLDDNRVIITGRRAIATLTLPDDVEARIDHLPLMEPRRREIDRQRRELIQYGWDHAETQPRLTVRQRGRNGTLRVAVKLALQ